MIRSPKRLLSLFANLDSHEAATALSLMLAMFSLLMSYYLIENARGPMILRYGSGSLGRMQLPLSMFALRARHGASLRAAEKVG